MCRVFYLKDWGEFLLGNGHNFQEGNFAFLSVNDIWKNTDNKIEIKKLGKKEKQVIDSNFFYHIHWVSHIPWVKM